MATAGLAVATLVTVVGPAGASVASQRLGALPELPPGARALGPLSGSTPVSLEIVLRPRDPSELARLATAVSTAGNPAYRHYLPVGGFARRFGPRAAQLSAVDGWLRRIGLSPGAPTSDHLLVPVEASATSVERAFAVHLERFAVGDRLAYANDQSPLVPRALASVVGGVVGLSTLARLQPLSLTRATRHVTRRRAPSAVTGGLKPCASATEIGTEESSYTANQIASAYGFSTLYGGGDEGAGQTIALFELEPDLPSDIAAYQACYGTSATVSYITVDGGVGSGAGSGEASLDVENVIGLAPRANVEVYQAPNTDSGVLADYAAIFDADSASVVSTSWGECEADLGPTEIDAESTLFEQAATQGQSVVAAAGDDGSEDCGTGTLAADDPGTQPYVTSVGGTTLSALGPPPTQTVWNEALLGGGAGGGGISMAWKMPTYQLRAPPTLNVVTHLSTGAICGAAKGSYCREVPDVSADADPYTGYVTYYDGSWQGVGGTSAAAPLWAALLAETDASAACHGSHIGFANPALYKVAGSAKYAASFSDIKQGNNDYTGTNDGRYPAGVGFDMASGLGTPIAGGLAPALCGGSTGNVVTVADPGNKTSKLGSKVTLKVRARDSAHLALSYVASDLPKGLRINGVTGEISGKPTAKATRHVSVTVTDPTGAWSYTFFTWTVH